MGTSYWHIGLTFRHSCFFTRNPHTWLPFSTKIKHAAVSSFFFSNMAYSVDYCHEVFFFFFSFFLLLLFFFFFFNYPVQCRTVFHQPEIDGSVWATRGETTTNKLELAWHVFLLLGIITKRLNNKTNTRSLLPCTLSKTHNIGPSGSPIMRSPNVMRLEAEEVGKARFNVATPTYATVTCTRHIQHTFYRIIYKQNPFTIISRGVQPWNLNGFSLKIILCTWNEAILIFC